MAGSELLKFESKFIGLICLPIRPSEESKVAALDDVKRSVIDVVDLATVGTPDALVVNGIFIGSTELEADDPGAVICWDASVASGIFEASPGVVDCVVGAPDVLLHLHVGRLHGPEAAGAADSPRRRQPSVQFHRRESKKSPQKTDQSWSKTRRCRSSSCQGFSRFVNLAI